MHRDAAMLKKSWAVGKCKIGVLWKAPTQPRLNQKVWFGLKGNLAKLKADELCLHLEGAVDIKSSTTVREVGVWLDSELIMHDHTSRTAYSCFFHLRRLRQLHGVICHSTMQQLISAQLSRLDYCNVMLAGIPSTTPGPLWQVVHAAVRLVVGLGPRDQVSKQLELHWLPIRHFIGYQSDTVSISSCV